LYQEGKTAPAARGILGGQRGSDHGTSGVGGRTLP
jgi:hypothetical protein